MTWRWIVKAAAGCPKALDGIIRRSRNDDVVAPLATLLLLDAAPSAAAALVAAADAGKRGLPPLIHAALTPSVAPALAAWRADPQWTKRAIGDKAQRAAARGLADLVGALRAHPAALHDAVTILLRSGSGAAIGRCLESLGMDGWASIPDEMRTALLAQAPASALGRVWTALDEPQRAAAVRRAVCRPSAAARLIGAIGAAAWQTTAPDLRRRLIDAVADSSCSALDTAPVWPGMTDDERARLTMTVIEQGDAIGPLRLLEILGVAGRAHLAAAQRAALETRTMADDRWRILAFRAADDGWNALTDDERGAVLATAARVCWNVPILLRDVGVAGWNALRADAQDRIAVVVRHAPHALFRCPPTLWRALAGADLPPATDVPTDARTYWRAEDADADLGGLPPAHQAVALALAPWRTEDAVADSARIRRLRAAWSALTDDERVALALAHSSMPATVAAAAHLAGGASAAGIDVGETLARVVTATGGGAAKRAVGAMLAASARWRSWMIAFVPTADDPPDVREAWRAAVRRGLIADVTLCARLAANRPTAAPPPRVRQRAGRRRRVHGAPSPTGAHAPPRRPQWTGR